MGLVRRLGGWSRRAQMPSQRRAARPIPRDARQTPKRLAQWPEDSAQNVGGKLMSIPTYFSHSYRVADQELNQTFWSHFSKAEFSFFVDPPSDSTIHTHLERMMRRCSAFVGV